MKQFIRHSFLSLTIIFSMCSIIYFMNSCSDGSDTSESSFLTQPCSETWEDRYSMLSLNLSWVSSKGDLTTEDNQTYNTFSYTVSSKDADTIVYNVKENNDKTAYGIVGGEMTPLDKKEQFEAGCEYAKTIFNRDSSTAYDQTKTISGKTYKCKYITATLTPEEADTIFHTPYSKDLYNKATSPIIFHTYMTSKEMFSLSSELLFEIDGKKYVKRDSIESIN